MKTAIIIPARYGSTRFPGKPLVKIAGRTMLERVVEVGRKATAEHDDIDLMVATEDQRIADHCQDIDVPCLITSDNCHTGSDRVLEAAQKSGNNYDFIISLQGDAPFTPPIVLQELIKAIQNNPQLEVVTPIHNLAWEDLDHLREAKKITPFSGTTVIRDHETGYARWFSKQIIPAIRNEEKLRQEGNKSPIFQHIGVYAYRKDILEKYVTLPQSHYEILEGLEQLRLLENGISIFTVKVIAPSGMLQAGIDSPEDVERAEKILAQCVESP